MIGFLVSFNIHPLFSIQARVRAKDADSAISLAAEKLCFFKPTWETEIEECILLGGVSAVAVMQWGVTR